MSRYERKYHVHPYDEHDLHLLLKTHPSHFSEIFHRRYVNNIYLDSFDFHAFRASHYGLMQRKKLRIRWYGNLFGFIEKPILEIKSKNNLIGFKETYPIKSFMMDPTFNYSTILKAVSEASIPASIVLSVKNSRLTLINRYQRRYYLCHDKKFRITVDTNIEFIKPHSCWNSFLQKSFFFPETIMELKYDSTEGGIAERISSFFPFSLSKFSKYYYGVQTLNGFAE